MKKKPHQQQSEIKKVFSDFKSRLHKPESQLQNIQYEIKENVNGSFLLVVHQERGANQTFQFETKKQLNDFLKSVS